jgi:ABC-2 type transport system ATP-binding protein
VTVGSGREVSIEVSELTKEYGETTAVGGVSFEVFADEVFAVVGPTGAGKTTLVEMLECLRTPTSGTASVLGFDIASEGADVKRHIGVLPQSFHTFERLTVRENVALTRRLYEDGRAVDEVLAELDLTEYADTRFNALSGGYQQRTGLAMALVSDPDVLFLDEPTTGLDPAARRTTWAQIERLADRGTTVVLTTHYMDEVEELADRAALLVEGELLAVDAVSTLVDTYGGDVKLIVDDRGDADGDLAAILEAAAGEVYRDDADDLVGVFEDRSAAQEAFGRLDDVAGDRSIDLVSAGMEDVFLELAGGTLDAGGDLR